MSVRISHYFNPEDDRLHRFYIPLNHFQMYANDMENYLLKKQIKACDYEEDELDFDEYEEDEEDGIDSTLRYFLGDNHVYSIQFPNILRSSLLISIYSFLENQLTRLCKELQMKMELSVKYNSINGKGIEKAKVYLSDVVKLDFPSGSQEWQKINNYQNIRNCFAHSEGIVKDEDKKLIRSIEKLDNVSIQGDIVFGKSIVLGKDFISNFIETIKAFWGMIEEPYLELLYPYHYWYKK
ncbi:hypothetical protein [Priestia megaterium]|uniref:hypothetical protein n=1 Tax=Priestia megaterium TaxID=1404 RepID=UPI0025A3D46A|nr:hypothetical protein [Priestia megaterium]MDM8149979.1 hypothetical protein [Priestia megaterium]